MLKSILLFSAVILYTFTPTPTQGGRPQEPSPAPIPAQEPAPAPAPVTTASNPVKPTAESQAKAKGLYQIDCALCHGDHGNGQTDVAKSMELTMPDFTDPKTLASVQDGQLFDVIRNGKDKMPPEAAGRANDTLVWNLIIYIRGMSRPQPLAK
jgi:mono/diheme cytochrome c family protein